MFERPNRYELQVETRNPILDRRFMMELSGSKSYFNVKIWGQATWSAAISMDLADFPDKWGWHNSGDRNIVKTIEAWKRWQDEGRVQGKVATFGPYYFSDRHFLEEAENAEAYYLARALAAQSMTGEAAGEAAWRVFYLMIVQDKKHKWLAEFAPEWWAFQYRMLKEWRERNAS